MKGFDFTFLAASIGGITVEFLEAMPGAISWILQCVIGVLTIWYLLRKIKHLKK